MRTLLEMMLDSLDVPREKTVKDKVIRISTHERITNYSDKLGTNKDAFMALKWLGNHGSHGGVKVTRSSINDACILIGHLIDFLFQESPDVTIHIDRINNVFAPKKE